ncbi:MAG: hypothetical protein AB7V56_01765 [Candidatus Nitrosocosmicus sp.]|jgi:hypothetical protein|uniref:hypothetical protein n=1 Tax=Candidatus Nitrosocosmicus agrestis TaxID=2563600 RepID=UPI00122E24B2|nr:hypothetical protein [Candidatus Nitrosocosmicus sp. SS]KAA2281990.1 hypothetical protein F1Z66_07480 [Candidatus Nitrosocosmicus sp. SS]KAF0869895.1 hypothetical protein E5N71_02755 [Candidatus Nitrosocosmicus sp. SS]MDR4490689.1 hypothetical protein [Candidatus Nitrosocosmicus sp.]
MEQDNEDHGLISEYWILAFTSPTKTESVIYRQFLATDYYDAYDKVLTFAEKTFNKVIWFKEKRKCGLDLGNRVLPDLEHICTFCNKEFNLLEPVRCGYNSNQKTCNAEFCSFNCKDEHFYLMHIKRNSNIL